MFKKTICIMIVYLFLILSFSGCSLNNNKEVNNIELGHIGNKIVVDGAVAYVAGENKILVPYNFIGNYRECDIATYDKTLKGCENPRLPSNETDQLPKIIANEIVSFYRNIGGFWTSMEADHAPIEFIDSEPTSLHYAGVITDYLNVGEDGVADKGYGYILTGTDDITRMGLLVLYDVADEFEFIDVNDTSQVSDISKNNPDVSINQDFISDLGLTYGEISAKYGKVTQSDYLDGGIFFMFENSPGIYFFMDENGNSANRTPDDSAMCFVASTVAGTFFDNFEGVKAIEDIEKETNITIEEGEDLYGGGHSYYFEYLNYDGYINDYNASQGEIYKYANVRVYCKVKK